jgi:hypothetical protein
MFGGHISSKYSISYTSFGNRLEPCDDIPDLPFVEGLTGSIFGTKTPNLQTLDLGSCIDEFEFISFFDLSGEELEIYDNSLVWIILRVEYESFRHSDLVLI